MAEIRVNATGALKLYDNDDSHFVGLQAGSISSDVTFTLPTADGSNGQVLTTNGSGTLSFATASSADPSSADGDSLGTASLEWSDLYLADGGIIYFGNDQDVTLTHDPDDGLFLKSIATADNNPVLLTLQTGETDLAQDDVIGKIAFQAPDESTGTDAILVSAAIQAVAEGDHSSSSNATSLQFMTGASEAAAEKMTLTSAGILNAGKIGVINDHDLGEGIHIKLGDSGASADDDADALVIEDAHGVGLSLLGGNDDEISIHFGDDGDANIGFIKYHHNSNYLNFGVNGDEAIRISSTHSTNINYGNNSNAVVSLYVNGHLNNTVMAVRHGTSSSTDETLIAFTDGADQASGSIKINPNANTVSYNTSSDYRLKENVNYSFDATTELKKLKPAKFSWKSDSDSTVVEGFLAHEVSDIVPLAVQGTKDETEVIPNGVYNANGNLHKKDVLEDEWIKGKASGAFASDTTWSASKTIPKYQVIDQSKLVPLLVKTVQELEARIKTLEDA